ncbi:MAG: hypothetical protein ACRCU9_08500 [Iodobacter sp.]
MIPREAAPDMGRNGKKHPYKSLHNLRIAHQLLQGTKYLLLGGGILLLPSAILREYCPILTQGELILVVESETLGRRINRKLRLESLLEFAKRD